MLFRFRNFDVYREARVFRRLIYQHSKAFPSHEQFGLTSQMRRAVNAILLNIAEGSNRLSDQDFGRFLNTAITSLEEVVACADIAFDEGYIAKETHGEILSSAEKLGKQLIAFSAKLRVGSKGLKF